MRQVLTQALTKANAAIDETSAPINAQSLFTMSGQVIMTGTASGTAKLQYSNDIVDPSTPPATPTNWNDIPSATVTLTGTAGAFALPKVDLCYAWVKLVYTHNNGSAGTVTVNLKAFGA